MKLTRYLYEKSYVEYSLLISLLERDSEKSLFWAYELYFSGFKTQVLSLIWKYYYLLYGCFHVRLERYMKKKTEQWLNNKKNYIILGTIVFNMSTREPCIDSYLMMQNIIELPNILTEWTTRLHNAENPIIVLEDFINKYNCYKTKGKHLFTVTKETIEDIMNGLGRKAFESDDINEIVDAYKARIDQVGDFAVINRTKLETVETELPKQFELVHFLNLYSFFDCE